MPTKGTNVGSRFASKMYGGPSTTGVRPHAAFQGLKGSCNRSHFTWYKISARSIVPPPSVGSPKEMETFLKNYMPIKFGSALFSKLRKKYWTKDYVAGAPLVRAIEDFSASGSMIYTGSSLQRYLFGYEHKWEKGPDGTLKITPHRIKEHVWGTKIIPSGFFRLPDVENVSAVVFSNSGTISKFNRMGAHPYGPRRYLL